MATPKVIVQIYPVLPDADRADRERKRPLGRNRDVYHEVLHETLDLVKQLDEMGGWGISRCELHTVAREEEFLGARWNFCLP